MRVWTYHMCRSRVFRGAVTGLRRSRVVAVRDREREVRIRTQWSQLSGAALVNTAEQGFNLSAPRRSLSRPPPVGERGRADSAVDLLQEQYT
mmetsp:Transcript_5027/g.13906  ORF Transcript_5027/g.13906 Transcript_5027/m.13906 type:complete len:92 (+) Transcript_5027:604-879(+)